MSVHAVGGDARPIGTSGRSHTRQRAAGLPLFRQDVCMSCPVHPYSLRHDNLPGTSALTVTLQAGNVMTYRDIGSTPARYRLSYESPWAEVSDSITWRRFCRIPLDGTVPHPTLMS